MFNNNLKSLTFNSYGNQNGKQMYGEKLSVTLVQIASKKSAAAEKKKKKTKTLHCVKTP